jgi:nucleotide-binding universal stress UspA family protein
MKILSATDLLPKSDAAIERAGLFADSLNADLTIVHAVPPFASDGNALDQRVRRADSRLAARTSSPRWQWGSRPDITVQCGLPSRVVLDNAYRHGADLVVLGPHRERPVADAVNGTITEKVLGAAACPVLIAHRETRGPYRHVLVALDGSSHSGSIMRAVESLGLTHDGGATVLHAHEPLYLGMMNIVGVGTEAAAAYAETSREAAAAGIRELVGAQAEDQNRYRIVVVEQRPATAILGAVKRLKPDLVVLGTRGHGRFRRALLGSVASEVIGGVDCDVLLVPERAGRTARAGFKRLPASRRSVAASG